jgi:hypothetical protein
MKKCTIAQAVMEVLKENQPMTIAEITQVKVLVRDAGNSVALALRGKRLEGL